MMEGSCFNLKTSGERFVMLMILNESQKKDFTLVEMSSNLLQSGPLFLTQCVSGLVSEGCVKKRPYS